MPSGETAAHKHLKTLAAQWAISQGCRSVGYEISLPHSGYRADVAAYRWAAKTVTTDFEGRRHRQSQATLGSTIVFECKQSRADLFKDSCQTLPALAQLEKWQTRRATIERLLKLHYPSAGLGDSLFQEYESFDFAALGHRGHTRLLQKIEALQNALLKKTKFEKLVRYRCANLFYLVTPAHLLTHYELPLSWGLLTTQNGDSLELIRKAQWLPASEGARLGILQRIAATRTPFRRPFLPEKKTFPNF